MSTRRVAVVQAGSVLFDTPRTLEKLAGLTAAAAGRGAELVVFPEAFVGGYPKGLGFGARMGSRTPEGREEFRRYFDAAIEVPGPATAAIGAAARAHGVHLVVGAVERAGSTLYCTALFFGPDGSLLGRHRKLMPTAAERLVWGQGDGSTLPVIDTPVGKVGAVICWENYMPLLRAAMYAKGVEVYCAVTVDDRDTWLPTVRHVALEGRCFVLSACQFLTRRDCPADYAAGYGDDPGTVLIRGGSCVVGPLGQVLAGPVFGEEAILTADLDPADLPRARYDFDPVGHYARPDVLRLVVDEAPRPAVEFRNPPAPADRVHLRAVGPGDLPRLYEIQRDPEANRVAVTTPRDRAAFDAHWAAARADPRATTRAVLVGGELVGYVCCFPADGRPHVGYWIDRAWWGRGVATRAVELLLREVADRPLFAAVATSNGASLRVLQKCGFAVESVRQAPATDRYPACEEAVLVLRAGAGPE